MVTGQHLRDERIARVLDREVAPLWHDRFGRLLLRHLPSEGAPLVLDVCCAGGRTTAELLERLPRAARMIAIEPDPVLRDLAKNRLVDAKDRVYVKAGGLDDVAAMAAASYDLVVANLVLAEATSLSEALRELVRVTKPGGQILATLPLDGSWAEAEDLWREVLRDAGLPPAIRRLKRLAHLRPTGHELARAVAEAGVGPHHFVIEQERFELLFASGRDFLFSPVIEHGPLRLWKAIIGAHDKPQELFWRLKEAVDAYYAGHVFGVTVCAGLVRIRVPAAGNAAAHAAAETAGEYWGQWPTLDALWQAQERHDAAAAATTTDLDVDIDMDAEAERERERPVAPVVSTVDPSASASMSLAHMSAEDEAIFALLEQAAPARARGEDLDALLDQVLEFGPPAADAEELEEEEIEEIVVPRKPGDTLERIRALMPPPPGLSTPAPRIPPPVPRKPKDS